MIGFRMAKVEASTPPDNEAVFQHKVLPWTLDGQMGRLKSCGGKDEID